MAEKEVGDLTTATSQLAQFFNIKANNNIWCNKHKTKQMTSKTLILQSAAWTNLSEPFKTSSLKIYENLKHSILGRQFQAVKIIQHIKNVQ